jgi:hypothetical protein
VPDVPVPTPELPDDPPLPATLYGSSSGIGIRGRFRISIARLTATENVSLLEPIIEGTEGHCFFLWFSELTVIIIPYIVNKFVLINGKCCVL